MGFFADLINRPEAAIETLETKRTAWKWVLLFIVTGFLLVTNFFTMHFKAVFPEAWLFTSILGIIGIIVEFAFVMGFIFYLYLILKLFRYEPAGETCKLISWLVIVPSCIYYLGLTGLNLFFQTTGMLEFAPYAYDTLKFLLYIWVIGLAVVAVVRNQPEHQIRNTFAVIGTFALNWVIWAALTADLFQGLYTGFI